MTRRFIEIVSRVVWVGGEKWHGVQRSWSSEEILGRRRMLIPRLSSEVSMFTPRQVVLVQVV